MVKRKNDILSLRSFGSTSGKFFNQLDVYDLKEEVRNKASCKKV